MLSEIRERGHQEPNLHVNGTNPHRGFIFEFRGYVTKLLILLIHSLKIWNPKFSISIFV